VPSTRLVLDRTGWFPSAGVGWLGTSDLPGPLADFQAQLSRDLSRAGFRAEKRRWRPHVTLYRDLRTRPARIDFEPVEWAVSSFALMASEPAPGGVRYRALGTW